MPNHLRSVNEILCHYARTRLSWPGLAIVGVVCLSLGADWRQFRGNATDGIAPDSKPPVTLTKESIAWNEPLPGRGISGPIVVGDRVIATSSSGFDQDRLHVQCFDRTDGRLIWHRQFLATGNTRTHKKTCVAAPQPASDGERIFAFFSSNDLICLDLDGRLLWYRGLNYDYPNANNSLGMASSPVVVGNTVVAQVEADAVAFATGLDVATGKTRWKIDRPRKANWTSPLVTTDAGGRRFAVLQSSAGLEAIDPYTGKTQWKYTDGAATIPSSAVFDGTIYAASNGITAIEPKADKTARKLWQAGNLSLATASPLAVAGRLYTLNRSTVLTCSDLKTGKAIWKLRVKGPISASPVYAAGHLYLVSETGLVQIVKLGDKAGEVVSKYDLAETVLATPAVADNAIFIRGDTDGHLWRIGAPSRQ